MSMAKKKARTAKEYEEKEIESQNDDFEEKEEKKEGPELIDHDLLTSENLPKTADVYLKNWLARSEIDDNFFQCTLYKFEKGTGASKEFIDQWEDQILTEHEIGLRHGGGRYLLFINAKGRDGKNKVGSKKLKIHSRYDELSRRHKMGLIALSGNSTENQNVIPQNNGIESITMSLNIMKELMSMFLPLLNAGSAQRTDPFDMTKMMSNMFNSVNSVMKQNLLDNSQFYNDMQRELYNMDSVVESDNEISGVQGFINSVAPLLEAFLPSILGGGKPAQKTVSQVKNLPIYNKLVQSQQHVQALTKFIEAKHGKQAVDKVVKSFGLGNDVPVSPKKKIVTGKTIKK